jgi:hypothetical protein
MTFRAVLAAIVVFGALAVVSAQQDNRIHLPPMVSQGPGASSVPTVSQEEIDKKRELKWDQERQEQIRRDTARLAELSAELKDSMDKTGTNILSMEMVKKAEAIEKLAKNVKNKMRER